MVIDRKTGVPVQGVSVYFGTENGRHYETETDPSGQFRIAGMANGDYGIHFEKSGYISQYSGSQNSPLKAVHIAAGQDLIRVTVSLEAYAKLRGRVVDSEGNAVAYAKIAMAPLEETADDKGEFTFSPLTPGSYALKATPARGSHPASNPAPPDGADRIEFLPTWYPSATESDQAELIAVHGGDELSGYEIHLQSSPVYRVRGRVIGLDGKPVPIAGISNASPASQAFASGVASGKPGESGALGYFTLTRTAVRSPSDGQDAVVRDGAFELKSVPRGLRRFTVTPIELNPAQNRSGEKPQIDIASAFPAPTTVSVVVDHDIDGMEIRLMPPIAIETTVELAETPADQTPRTIRDTAISCCGTGSVSVGKKTANGQRFENVAPGEIAVSAAPGLAGGYYLSSVSLGGRDVTWKSVDIQAGAPPFRIVYKPNAGTITGTVETADATAVVLIPQAALDSVDVQYGRVSPSSAAGAFEIDSVGPGAYYAFAVDRFDPEKFGNTVAARKIANAAAVVQVTEGSTSTVKAPFIRLE